MQTKICYDRINNVINAYGKTQLIVCINITKDVNNNEGGFNMFKEQITNFSKVEDLKVNKRNNAYCVSCNNCYFVNFSKCNYKPSVWTKWSCAKSTRGSRKNKSSNSK